MKLAVIGANGQVGTELCFLLRENVDLIPIVRNKLGTIFLKHNGFKCCIADILSERFLLERPICDPTRAGEIIPDFPFPRIFAQKICYFLR